MGKGDRKSKRGKIFMGTYGNPRPRKLRKKIISSEEKTEKVKKKTTKKATVKKKKTTKKATEKKKKTTKKK